MGMHRLKHSFTAGELSPLMYDRYDFDRHKNGCRTMKNMVCVTQGPVTRRPGFKFIYDMSDLDQHPTDKRVRMIPFIFNEFQAYGMLFYIDSASMPTVVFCSGDGLLANPGVVYLPLEAGFDIENFDYAQTGDDIYIAQEGISPSRISRLTDQYTWQYAALTITDQPADWGTPDQWPRKVTFHQQRSVWGSTLSRRQTIWMSEAGDFTSFAVSTPLVGSDAVTFTMDSGTQNRIQWLVSSRALNVGTVGDEWTVTGGGLAAITADNVFSQRQTTNGSEGVTPLTVGLTTMFLEQHGRIVNEFTYEYINDSYNNLDMTILSPHLTEVYSIQDWTYQRTPDSIIWSVRTDGGILGITYQKQHKVVGWHRHDTNGNFKAITSVPGSNREDDVWTVVSREINGSTRYYVEKLGAWQRVESPVDGRFLDSYAEYDDVPTDTLSGLDHLEGETVQVLADGTVHPDVVVSSGAITLNNEYSNIAVGFSFVSEVWPLTGEVQTANGTALGRMQRITNIDIDIYKSLGMIVGRYDTEEDEEFYEEVPFRVPADLTGQAVPLHSGIVHLEFPEGYDRESIYFIRQEQPLPLMVRSVVDTIEVFE